ncbi:MAG TPA: GNAT family N-acetyltransferase [Ktedonobacteraceae bacterium]
MVLTERTLLRLHVEAVWGVRLPSITQSDVMLLPESQRPSWKVCAAEIPGERVHIWRIGIDAIEREELLASAYEALPLPPMAAAAAGINRDIALRQVAPPSLDVESAQLIARPLTPHDEKLLETFQPGSAEYFLQPDCRPLTGVIVDGRLLSLAHSSRRTSEACELGIDTLPEARRRGYALAATVLWAATVSQEGLVPLYSTSVENEASLGLAAAAGYRVFAKVATVESKLGT